MGSEPTKKQKSVLQNALAMATGTMTSRVLGLVRDMAFAAMFDRTITDAWGVAFRLPNMFRRLLGEGSLSVAFVPVYVEAKNDSQNPQRSAQMADSFFTLLMVVLSTLTLLGILFSPEIIGLIVDEAFSEIPGKFELTVHMSQIMFGFIFLMSTYAFWMGILNSYGEFALPAMAPTLFNVAMILANFFPLEWQKVPGDALAWGVLIGGFLQAGVLVPSLLKRKLLPKLSLNFGHPDSLKVWRNMIPGIFGTGLMQITTIINTNFASSLGEGSNTYIYLADRLLELPLSLVAVSLGAALLPSLSQMYAQKEIQKMHDTVNYYLRVNLLICLPAAMGLFLLAEPLVKLLFGRGQFLQSEVLVTSQVVMIYALSLVVVSSVRVLVPGFYAIKNTWLPACVSAVCLIGHVLLAPILMQKHGLNGLVFSTFCSGLLNLVLVLLSYQLLVGSLGLKKVLSRLAVFLLPLGLLSAIVFVSKYFFLNHVESSFALLTTLVVTIVLSAIVFFLVCIFLQFEELKKMPYLHRFIKKS